MTQTPESIGERLKRLRLAAGLSQRELASPGVSYAYISRIEAGTRQPSVKALRKLAERLGVSAGYLELGVERTETDDLVEALVRRTGLGLGAVTFRLEPTPEVALSFGCNGESRTVTGSTLTDAVRAALAWVDDLDLLREDRERLDRKERELLGAAT